MLRLTSILAFATTSFALTFTSPFAGSTIDLTAPLSVTWIPGPSDPSTFTLEIVNTDSGSSAGTQILATNLQTSKGSYTLAADAIDNYGDGFELSAIDSNGVSLGSSGTFSLAEGYFSVETASNGVLTLATSTTQQESAPSSTSVPDSAATSSGNSASLTITKSSPMPTTSSAESDTTVTSSASPAMSSSAQASSTSSQSQTSSSTSSSAAKSSSGSSNSSSNLGFDSAAGMVRASILVSSAAFLGALALLV